VEDEQHLLFDCPAYTDLRNNLIANYSGRNYSNFVKGTDKLLSLNVAKYVFHAINRRKQIIV
jgi:hypothetical protein